MPPKVRITKEDIIKTAIELVRKNGAASLNARAIAAALDCSTQPIFSNFKTMKDLEEATVAGVYEIYINRLKNEAESKKYPRYKAFGMAYVRFAGEEKELFKLLFMRDRRGEDTSPSPDFLESVEMLMNVNGISKEKAELMHLEIWTCVHGIAVILATSFLALEWELISSMMTDIYQGVRSRHISEENKNESN